METRETWFTCEKYFAFPKDSIKISAFARLGVSEEDFVKSYFGRYERTRPMQEGSAAHQIIAEKFPMIRITEITQKLNRKEQFGVREVPVIDKVLKLHGIADGLYFTSGEESGKIKTDVIEDKTHYVLSQSREVSPKIALQIAAYASAIKSDNNLSGLCYPGSGTVRHIQRGTNNAIEIQIDHNTLELWISRLPIAIKRAKELIETEKSLPQKYNLIENRFEALDETKEI